MVKIRRPSAITKKDFPKTLKNPIFLKCSKSLQPLLKVAENVSFQPSSIKCCQAYREISFRLFFLLNSPHDSKWIMGKGRDAVESVLTPLRSTAVFVEPAAEALSARGCERQFAADLSLERGSVSRRNWHSHFEIRTSSFHVFPLNQIFLFALSNLLIPINPG